MLGDSSAKLSLNLGWYRCLYWWYQNYPAHCYHSDIAIKWCHPQEFHPKCTVLLNTTSFSAEDAMSLHCFYCYCSPVCIKLCISPRWEFMFRMCNLQTTALISISIHLSSLFWLAFVLQHIYYFQTTFSIFVLTSFSFLKFDSHFLNCSLNSLIINPN